MTSFLTGRRTAWVVAAASLLLAVLAIVLVGQGTHETRSTDALPDGRDSTEGTALLDRLPDESTSVAVVLFTADRGRLSPTQLDQVGAAVPDLRAAVGGPGAPAGGQRSGGAPGLVPSEDGTAALVVTPVRAGSATAVADAVADLRRAADRAAPDGVTAAVTGPAAVEADLAAVFDGADGRLLMVTALVVAVLLVVTYRSPVLWVVPLVVVGVADQLAAVLATHLMAATGVAWDESTVGILSVLVFGAGTDYALLLISRYRDELRREQSRHRAMAHAVRRTAEAVLASATTVVLGLLTLLLSLTPTTRGLGLACAVGVAVAATFALVVLPAALVVFGRWVFWPRVPHVGQTAVVDSDTVWSRIGGVVARRPAAVVVSTVLVIAALAVGVCRIDLGLDESEQFLDRPEAISAADRLAQSFPAGAADPTQVVTTGDVRPVVAAARGVDGVVSAEPGASGGGVAVVEVVLDRPSGANTETITALRDAVAPYDAHVTGSEAAALDVSDADARDRWLILPLILALVVVGLLLLLRSVLAPLLLVATVVGTYAASMGLSWWLFTGPLGFSAMDGGVPLLAFLFLVALGVDYNIFLVTRAREESAEHGTRGGMLRALTATGGVITSAGVLLAAVFAVLGVLPLVVLAQLGTIICVGVLLDTLVVRTLLVPAIALLLGDRFWWPRRPGTPRSA